MYVSAAGPYSSSSGFRYSRLPFFVRRQSGIGSTTSVTAATIAASGASTTASLLVAFGAIAGPIGAAIGAIAAVGVLLAKVFQGCGQTCVAATAYANQVEQALQQNLQSYLSAPVRTSSIQAAAINNYNTAIAALVQACGQAQLGSAGQNCIDQRVNASSCEWQASPGGWTTNSDGTCTYTPWGASGSGTSCWNWVIGYLDPIQNDPCVQSDSVLLTSVAGTSTLSGNSSAEIFGLPAPLVIGGLIIAALLI